MTFPQVHNPDIFQVAWDGDDNVLKTRLEKEDVNIIVYGGKTLLLIAARRGHLSTAKLLLRHGADPSLSGGGYSP